MIMKAAAIACLKVPEANSQWKGDSIRKFNKVDMNFAVQTDMGLVAPKIDNIHLMSLEEIATKSKDIAKRARDNKLTASELEPGTFCISNMGMYGVTALSAIIMPP